MNDRIIGGFCISVLAFMISFSLFYIFAMVCRLEYPIAGAVGTGIGCGIVNGVYSIF